MFVEKVVSLEVVNVGVFRAEVVEERDGRVVFRRGVEGAEEVVEKLAGRGEGRVWEGDFVGEIEESR